MSGPPDNPIGPPIGPASSYPTAPGVSAADTTRAQPPGARNPQAAKFKTQATPQESGMVRAMSKQADKLHPVKPRQKRTPL